MNRRRALYLCGPLAALLIAGCGGDSTAVVSGEVTYDGQAVENGAITLVPEDGKGPSVGSPITEGRYRVEGVVPGKKLVQIVGFKGVRLAKTTDELRQAAEAALSRGEQPAPPKPAIQVPPDAQGNNQAVTIEPGRQTLDFHLKPPGPGNRTEP